MTLDAPAFLRSKRDGRTHRPEEIRAFVEACVDRRVPDYQLSAWLMAAFLNGLDESETDALTDAMVRSGRVFDWSGIGGPSADKHSTGGVGDKVSLVVAPLVASCGVLVPMVAGRGLGHTGGTLDKLESIPGFRTQLSAGELGSQLKSVGVVIVGQGPDLAPADGLMYALRDVTGTVEFEPFIVSSIVSKKVAEGAQALIYDVKCGSGAFMKTRDDARRLARRLVATTRAMGRASAALVTDMSQPLGRAVGNSLEVQEAVEVLRGGGPPDVRALSLELAAIMLLRCGKEREEGTARALSVRALESGAAWEKFLALVRAQGGDANAVEHPERLPRAPAVLRAAAPRAGRLLSVDTLALGRLAVSLGAGRSSKERDIDPRVGLRVQARVGEPVERGGVLAELHVAEESSDLVARAAACFQVGDRDVEGPALVLERID